MSIFKDSAVKKMNVKERAILFYVLNS